MFRLLDMETSMYTATGRATKQASRLVRGARRRPATTSQASITPPRTIAYCQVPIFAIQPSHSIPVVSTTQRPVERRPDAAAIPHSGDTALERGWAEAARAAGYMEAERFFGASHTVLARL